MNNWTTDKLPKKPDDYIVTVKDGDYKWVTVAYFGKGQWYDNYDGYQHDCDRLQYTVTAWMPFPEPYKESQNAKE